jgi:hypothetical protein
MDWTAKAIADAICGEPQIVDNISLNEDFCACLERAIRNKKLNLWLEFFEEINEETGEAYVEVHQVISTGKGEVYCFEITEVPMSGFNQSEMQNNYTQARNLLMMCLKPLRIHQVSQESSYYEDTYREKKFIQAIIQNEAINNSIELNSSFLVDFNMAKETKILDITLNYFYYDVGEDYPDTDQMICVEQLITTDDTGWDFQTDYDVYPDNIDEYKAKFVAARETLMEMLKPYGIHGLEG